MTLILTIANRHGVHQSSDYQLTNSKTREFHSDEPGSKQLEGTFGHLQILLAFTGVAIGFDRRRTIDWLSDELTKLGSSPTNLEIICDALAKRCSAEIGSKGGLTLVLTVGEVERPFRVVRISNSGFATEPSKREFRREIRVVRKPFYLISGYREAVQAEQRHQLNALSRNLSKSPAETQDELARST